MSLNFDLFWSFRSPYSYLLLPRVVDLVASHDVTCTVRIVYPIAVRQADFFQKVDPLWVFYLMKDTYREAEYLGMPYRWPKPDPVYMDPSTRLYPPEQPHIHRLSQLGVAATEAGRGLASIRAGSPTTSSGTADLWPAGEPLAYAPARAGPDLATLHAHLAAHHAHYCPPTAYA